MKTYDYCNNKRISVTDWFGVFRYRCAKTKRELYSTKNKDSFIVYTKGNRVVFVCGRHEWEKMHDFICKELTAERDEDGFIIYEWDEKMGCVR